MTATPSAVRPAGPAHRAARPRRRGDPDTPRRALVHFVLAGVAMVVLIAIGGASVSRAVAEDQALDDAQRLNSIVARTVVEPHLHDGLLTGDPAAVAAMREAADLITAGPVARVKLWAADGRVVFSDDPRLIGRHYPLGAEEAEGLDTGRAAAEITDLGRD